ncbi:MAG: presqualene diphosphate synthase HpnD, partial [Candidatus Binatia bacterium]
ALLSAEDAPALEAAEIMRRTYAEILDRIAAEDYFVFGPRLGLSRGRKLALAATLWTKSFFR